jgi:hypothetical protein
MHVCVFGCHPPSGDLIANTVAAEIVDDATVYEALALAPRRLTVLVGACFVCLFV